MTELDYGQALVFLEKAIGEKGADWVYVPKEVGAGEVSCVYFDEGHPACIVGHVFDYMGIPASAVKEGLGARYELAHLGIQVDDAAKDLLDKVQEHQDDGLPWGQALKKAQGLE